ncbi:MAG: hypothetical protein DI536_01255 [Archangium gephyra]|uniref:Outer membrane protein beta-barrel domain-containing protein n=1 Tax=Archangium gephyra TaxID=48 RepID=A0A2W5U4G6_9BACT|nr:MAG: hypothetical protein DI536_01255 [Archangium gephyra]
MLTMLLLLAVVQTPPPLVSADADPNLAEIGFAPFPSEGPPPTPPAEPRQTPRPVVVNAPPPADVTPVAPVENEVRAAPQEDKHAAPTWQVAALATAIVPLNISGAPFVFGMRGELDIFRVGAQFSFDRGGVTPFTMSQTNEWTGLLGYSLVNHKYARVRLQGGMSALSGDGITARFGPSAGLTARAGLPFIGAEVGAIFTPAGGMRQLDARAEVVLRGGVFELHGGYRVRFYDATDAGTLSTLFATTPVAGPSIALGLTF